MKVKLEKQIIGACPPYRIVKKPIKIKKAATNQLIITKKIESIYSKLSVYYTANYTL